MNFSRGHSGTKIQYESCLFSQGNHQNSQKWAKFMNFSFWPFLWFGLPGRLLRKETKREYKKKRPNHLHVSCCTSVILRSCPLHNYPLALFRRFCCASSRLRSLEGSHPGLPWVSSPGSGVALANQTKEMAKTKSS